MSKLKVKNNFMDDDLREDDNELNENNMHIVDEDSDDDVSTDFDGEKGEEDLEAEDEEYDEDEDEEM